MFTKSNLVIASLSLASFLMIVDISEACGGRKSRGGRGRGGCGGGGCGGTVYVDQHCGHAGVRQGQRLASGTMLPGDARTSFYFEPNEEFLRVNNVPQNAGMIRIMLPDPQARVWFDGALTQQTGPDRFFHTPSLDANAKNTYLIRATWMQGGREVTQERTITVTPGRATMVDFVRVQGEQLPQKQGELIGQKQAQVQQLEGKILRTGQGEFVVETRDNRQITVYTNTQTRYTLNDKSGAVTDVRVGSSINIGVTMQGDRHIANTVVIRP